METYANDEMEINLLEILKVIKEKLWLSLLLPMIFAIGAGLISYYVLEPMYESKSKLYVIKSTDNGATLSDLQFTTKLTQDYMVLIKSRPVVEAVINKVGLSISNESMLSYLSVSNPSNTPILEISIKYSDPTMAKAIVDAFAEESRIFIASIMDTDMPAIIEEGNINAEPVSPNIINNILISGVLGLMLSIGIIVLIYILDDRIKSSEDITRYLGLTTLAVIPNEDKKRRKDKTVKGQR